MTSNEHSHFSIQKLHFLYPNSPTSEHQESSGCPIAPLTFD
jgi:hypothetical protein